VEKVAATGLFSRSLSSQIGLIAPRRSGPAPAGPSLWGGVQRRAARRRAVRPPTRGRPRCGAGCAGPRAAGGEEHDAGGRGNAEPESVDRCFGDRVADRPFETRPRRSSPQPRLSQQRVKQPSGTGLELGRPARPPARVQALGARLGAGRVAQWTWPWMSAGSTSSTRTPAWQSATPIPATAPGAPPYGLPRRLDQSCSGRPDRRPGIPFEPSPVRPNSAVPVGTGQRAHDAWSTRSPSNSIRSGVPSRAPVLRLLPMPYQNHRGQLLQSRYPPAHARTHPRALTAPTHGDPPATAQTHCHNG
jgi:hypothetical protein